jgi:hypothetical protein
MTTNDFSFPVFLRILIFPTDSERVPLKTNPFQGFIFIVGIPRVVAGAPTLG